MNRVLIVTVCMAAIIYVLSCRKTNFHESSCTGPKAVNDSGQLLSFARLHGITPMADTSWLYYQVINPGTGAMPTLTSMLYVRYAGRLMDGTYFDSTGVSTGYPLATAIRGWQIGLPKIRTGGRIKLLVPSALGLSCTGNGSSVPANAPLYFDIYLDSLK